MYLNSLFAPFKMSGLDFKKQQTKHFIDRNFYEEYAYPTPEIFILKQALDASLFNLL